MGYDKYNIDELTDMSSLGLFAFVCSVIGVVKTPYMTDFAQILFVLALNNIHYPLHLRSFLESTKLTFLNKFVAIIQDNMNGKGKFGYIVD